MVVTRCPFVAKPEHQGRTKVHGPRRTTREIRSLLEREVAALMRIGADHERAVAAIAERHRLPPSTVSNLLGGQPVVGIDLAAS